MNRDVLSKEIYDLAKKDPNKSFAQIEKEAKNNVGYTTIPFVYKYSIIVLGLLALFAAGAGILILIIDPEGTRKIPESLVAIGSASVGALVGIFATPPTGNGTTDT